MSRVEIFNLAKEISSFYTPTDNPLPDIMTFDELRTRVTLQLPNLISRSKPGFPFQWYHGISYQDCERFLSHDSNVQDLVNVVASRLYIIQYLDIEKICLIPPSEWALLSICFGLTDPVKVFIKNEPHSKKKQISGRWRLISLVGLATILQEKVLFRVQNKSDTARHKYQPTKCGSGLEDRDHLNLLQYIRNWTTVVDNDMSSWDWSISWHLLLVDCVSRILLAHAKPGDLFTNACLMEWRHLTTAAIMCSDGALYLPEDYAGQKSGSYNTSTTNGRLRFGLSRAARVSTRAATQGDDCVENSPLAPEELVKRYASFGFKCTPSVHGVTEFCSHYVGVKGYVPVSLDKSVYNLVSKFSWASLSSFMSNHRHDPASQLALLFLITQN